MNFKRILLKLSGEALMGDRSYGIDPEKINEYAQEIKQIYDQKIEIAIVIGGGITTRTHAEEYHKKGASFIVIGNALENNDYIN